MSLGSTTCKPLGFKRSQVRGGDPRPHPGSYPSPFAISTFCGLLGYPAAWVSHFLGRGGFPVRDGGALEAVFPEAELSDGARGGAV